MATPTKAAGVAKASAKKGKTDPAIEAKKAQVELVRRALAEGKIATLGDIAKLVRPVEITHAEAPFQVDEVPAELTDKQKGALKGLAKVFGSVVLTERRELTPDEVNALLGERAVIATIIEMAEKRKGDIRTTVMVGMDAEAEAEEGFDRETTLLSEDGFYIEGRKLGAKGNEQCFSREVRKGADFVDVAELARIADSGEIEGFDKKLFNNVTRPARVFDEEAALQLLRKKPELIDVILAATRPGKSTIALNVRKAK